MTFKVGTAVSDTAVLGIGLDAMLRSTGLARLLILTVVDPQCLWFWIRKRHGAECWEEILQRGGTGEGVTPLLPGSRKQLSSES